MENDFREIDPVTMDGNPFQMIGFDWMLITAGSMESWNTMTASWGGFGHLWDRNVTYCFIRPQRHTFNFIEKDEFYTFSFFPSKYRNALTYCGTHSGKDVDKAKEAGLTPVKGKFDTVYFEEARLVVICKKLYTHDMERKLILQSAITDEYYPPDNDIHRMYIGEVMTCLVK